MNRIHKNSDNQGHLKLQLLLGFINMQFDSKN